MVVIPSERTTAKRASAFLKRVSLENRVQETAPYAEWGCGKSRAKERVAQGKTNQSIRRPLEDRLMLIGAFRPDRLHSVSNACRTSRAEDVPSAQPQVAPEVVDPGTPSPDAASSKEDPA
jgi:hypothetical protein